MPCQQTTNIHWKANKTVQTTANTMTQQSEGWVSGVASSAAHSTQADAGGH